jgi:deoxyribodipyrimidine photo-lyase
MTAIWWIRRDLRLADNRPLTRALEEGQQIIPLFISDPGLLGSHYMAEKRSVFLGGGLVSLHEELRARGSRLILRTGRPAEVLAQVMAESGASAIFAQADYSPYAVGRDSELAGALPLHLVDGLTALSVGQVLKENGEAYTVFTPFKRRWLALYQPNVPLAAPVQIQTPATIASEALPPFQSIPDFPAGAAVASARLAQFIEGGAVFDYANNRDRPDLAGTSQLSPYLRFGMLSARQAFDAADQAQAAARTGTAHRGVEVWKSELIWREFYVNILHHFPQARTAPFRPEYAGIGWRNDPDDFAAWCAGMTGYPFVDAAMRQLAATGWMHNRARMVVASFLVKHLLIDWRWGERFFMQHLLDGDPAANNGGWQWAAGTGTDAAPYFRVFNPILQSRKFDPDGAYIRRWVPELANVPVPALHTPWEMSAREQAGLGCRIGQDYPAPVVEHAFARQRALETYKSALNAAKGD